MSKNKIRWFASAAAVLWAIATQAQSDDLRRLAFYTALTNEFIVSTNGKTEATDLIQMVDRKWVDSAAGNQATQPYKRMEVPMYPWGPADDPIDRALNMFRLRPDEAVVYLGPTPPLCDYFSFTIFLFLRNTNSVVPKGDWVFASVRDPLNNARIQTEAGPGQPFGVNTMVIFTADQTTYQAITNVAQQAGYPGSMLNLYTLPARELYLGVEPGTRPAGRAYAYRELRRPRRRSRLPEQCKLRRRVSANAQDRSESECLGAACVAEPGFNE